jgi:hypothetical protein
MLGAFAAFAVAIHAQAETVNRTSYISFVGEADIITETFDKPIKSVKATLVSGQADDIGFIDGVQVTDAKTPCSAVGDVLGPIDITPYVHIEEKSAWVLATAQNTCMSMVGWGPATQAGRAPGVIEWVVEVEDCDVESPKECECKEGSGATSVVYPKSISWSVGAKAYCPAIMGGGSIGSSFSVKASGENTTPTCKNDCKDTFSVAGSGELSLGVCAIGGMGGSITAALAGSVSDTKAYELTCGGDTCQQSCDMSNYCEQTSVELSGSVTRTWPMKGRLSFGASLLEAECGAEVSLSLKGNYKETGSVPEGSSPTCSNCKTHQLTGGATGGAYASCNMWLNLPGYSYPFGCDKCAFIEAGYMVGGKVSDGPDCVDGVCATSTISGKVQIAPRAICVDLFGYVVKGQVGGSISATRTADCNGSDSDVKMTNETGWSFVTGPNQTCKPSVQ